jgi:hypothetical protein
MDDNSWFAVAHCALQGLANKPFRIEECKCRCLRDDFNSRHSSSRISPTAIIAALVRASVRSLRINHNSLWAGYKGAIFSKILAPRVLGEVDRCPVNFTPERPAAPDPARLRFHFERTTMTDLRRFWVLFTCGAEIRRPSLVKRQIQKAKRYE